MPLTIKTSREIDAQGQAYIRAEVPELTQVGKKGSFVSGLTTGFFLAVHDLYRAFKRYADVEPFPQTATLTFFQVGWWLDITGLTRKQPAAATGSVVLTGTVSTLVAAGTELTSSGNTYTVDSAVSLASQSIVGTSETTSDPLVGRFVTASPHNLATGMTLTFSGCIDASLNGTFEIRVVDANTIEYDLDEILVGQALEPNPRADGVWANVTITATEDGAGSNLLSGSVITVSNPPAGLDTDALVTFDGLADGADLEEFEDWRDRVLEGLAVDYGMFSAAEIRQVAKTVPGVTRVFVRKPKETPTTGYPLEGQVRIAFLRENDADPIPSAAEVAQVRQKIYDELLPAHMIEEDCEVLAPERYSLEVKFLSITPDTPGMRASIRNNLIEYLAEKAEWGGQLLIEDIRCAIHSAYDTDTGQALASYELDTPTLDIALPVDAFPVLTGINWAV